MELDALLGLPLPAALDVLEAKETAARVVQSEPPFLPRGYTPQWGEERVLRVRQLDDDRIELLVGRELVGEERAGKTPATR